MEKYENENYKKGEIINQSRHQFIYGYDGEKRTSFLKDLENENKNSSIYQRFLNGMNSEYMLTNNKRKVIDYLSLMTDEYLIKEYLNFTKVTQNNN